VIFVSQEYGVVYFRCLEDETDFSDAEKAKMDDLDGNIFAKINRHEELRLKRRELKINVTPHVFIGERAGPYDDRFIELGEVQDVITENRKETLTNDEYRLLVAVIEGSSTLKAKKDRPVETTGRMTKGRVLSIIQNKVAVFDRDQKRAALNIIDSPQRIRGLAGSGKTIILAMKAALFHLDNPEAEILYTYTTKALFGQIKYMIEKYYRDFSDNREPNFKKIHIWHGWGGGGLTGVYSYTCSENRIEPISFPTAKRMNPKDPFEYVCKELAAHTLDEKFDLTLIDEGQDFPPAFYQVCYKITKMRRIVWAYDDFQNIFDVDIQDEKSTFGKDSTGRWHVDFSRGENILQDIVLHRCYRNPRYALINAFALGLGIYNDKVLQRLEDNQHWRDLGFEVEIGESKDHERMVVSRPEENSPIETNELFDANSVTLQVCDSVEMEVALVAEKIEHDVRQEQLRPDDICVIGIDARYIGRYFEQLEARLRQIRIGVFNMLNAANNNTYFSVEGCVTLSTINKAKGNETGMVYIVGVDAIFRQKDYAVERNKLFTAITRTKGWVTMTGVSGARHCEIEMDKLRKKNYKLDFIQPTKEETRMIYRRMTEEQAKINDLHRNIEEFRKAGYSEEEIEALWKGSIKPKK
jgi:superfamily I DNA and RNA helicase